MKSFRPIPQTLTRLVLIAVAVAAITMGPCASGYGGVAAQFSQVGAAPAGEAAGEKSPAESGGAEPHAGEIVNRVNEALGLDLNAAIANWQSVLDKLESDLHQHRVGWSQLDAYRDELQQMHKQAVDLSARLQSQLNSTDEQLNLLGPTSSAGEPQLPETALRRARLKDQLGILHAGEASAQSDLVRVNDLLAKIEDTRRGEFTSYLLRPVTGVYSYRTWSQVPGDVPETIRRIRGLVTDWWQGAQARGAVRQVGLEAALLFVALCLIGRRGVRRLRDWQGSGDLSFWQRASSTAGVVLFRTLPVAVPVVFAYVMTAAEEPFPFRLSWLFYLAAESVVIVFTVAALVTTVFAPSDSRWRLVAVSDAVAVRICGLVILLAFVYSFAALLYYMTLLVHAPFELTMAVALPSSLLVVGIVVAILRTPMGEMTEAGSSVILSRTIRSLVWVIVAAIVLCALTGYLALAHFLSQQLVVTGLILSLVYLMLVWVDGFSQFISDDSAVLGRWLREHGRLDQGRREQLALPVNLLLKLAVLIVAVPFIMLQWGYTWPDIEEWYRQVFFGFHIGNTPVTLGALLASVIVFAVGYAAARLFQGWLDARVLQPAGISGGVRHSIRTAVGYVGILIAALVAFSYAGFSLSSLAIVAGAFSIGIGFGLQNVVNNFVSGLILLVERPVRVGDLVVVGGEQGYVRKISVRSTELETFDRANVLIPNSAFVSEKVKNWTLRNRISRVAISVGTAYDCDPGEVRNILLRVACENPEVLRSPEPIVELTEFGSSSINFALYVFIDINDRTKTVRVRTDLSIAIYAAFAENGIAIPFTQADVRIANLDQVAAAIAAYAAQQQGRRPGVGEPAQPLVSRVR